MKCPVLHMQKLGKQCNFNGMTVLGMRVTNVSFIYNYFTVNFEQHAQTTETSIPTTKGTNGTQLKMLVGHVQHCFPLQLLLYFSGAFTTTKCSIKFP